MTKAQDTNAVATLKAEVAALKNQLRQAQNNERTINAENVVTDLMSLLTQPSQLLRYGDWVEIDPMQYQRKIILQGLMDKLDWLLNSPEGAETYAEKQKNRVLNAQRRFNGDELSGMFLRGAIAESKAATLKVMTLKNLMSQIEAAYLEENDEPYTPYGRTKKSNVRSDQPKELPADIAADLAELGLTPQLGTAINTNGVEDTRDL